MNTRPFCKGLHLALACRLKTLGEHSRWLIEKPWGSKGDAPVPRDYDGDGKTDFAVWRPSNGTWYVIETSNGKTIARPWGVSTDIAINKPVG